jgi:hypothetical protein
VSTAAALRLPNIPGRIVRRELLRLLLAFVLYLALGPVWDRAGAKEAYSTLVVGAASAVFVPYQHFPVIPTLHTLRAEGLDPLVILMTCLFLVSWSIPWRRRVGLFALAGAIVFPYHVLCFLLDVKVHSVEELFQQHQLLVLLPGEFWVVERLKYLLYDVGTEAGPMMVLIVTTAWNVQAVLAGARPPARSQEPAFRSASAPSSRRKVAWVTLACVAAVLASLFAWRAWRESHPLHVAAHARLGRLYLANGSEHGAAEQFRIAIAHGSTDPSIFFDLAGLEAKRGRPVEAGRLLERALRVTSDPVWMAQIQAALTRGSSAR